MSSQRKTIAGKIPVVGIVPSPVMTRWTGSTVAVSLDRQGVMELMAACDAALKAKDVTEVTFTVFRRVHPLRLTVTTR